MSDEIRLDDCLLIHAESFIVGFAGLSGMLEPMSRACESLHAQGVSVGRQAGEFYDFDFVHENLDVILQPRNTQNTRNKQ